MFGVWSHPRISFTLLVVLMLHKAISSCCSQSYTTPVHLLPHFGLLHLLSSGGVEEQLSNVFAGITDPM